MQTDNNEKVTAKNVTVNTPGRIVVYGDSNCIDYDPSQKRNSPFAVNFKLVNEYIHFALLFLACFWMLDALLEYVSVGNVPKVFVEKEKKNEKNKHNFIDTNAFDMPQRIKESNFTAHSKVVELLKVPLLYRAIPSCAVIKPVYSEPLNETVQM